MQSSALSTKLLEFSTSLCFCTNLTELWNIQVVIKNPLAVLLLFTVYFYYGHLSYRI